MLPDFLIIGAMKSGTSSLYHYLSAHPKVSMSTPKELNFFLKERNFGRGTEWYSSQFQGEAAVFGEASTAYTKYPMFAGVPRRICSIIPQAKLIYLLREPVSRAISQYNHCLLERLDERPLEAAFHDIDHNHYIDCSSYYMQLQQYLSHFPPEQILIVDSDELREDRLYTLRKVFAFIGVDPDFEAPAFGVEHHRSASKRRRNVLGRVIAAVLPSRFRRVSLPSPLNGLYRRATMEKVVREEPSAELVERVVRRLRDDVNSLKKLSGQEFPGWSLFV